MSQQSDVHLGRLDTAIYALPMDALLQRIHGPDGKRFLLELHSRFSYPAACLVLMLVGVPLGVVSRRGGKSSGFVFTLLLVVLYYVLSYTGIALGRQDKLSAFLAVWLANILFAAAGVFLLWQMASGGRVLSAIAGWASRLPSLKIAAQAQRPALSPGCSTGCSRVPRAAARAVSFPASSTNTLFANSLSCSSWCWPAL